jgi:hypothetical protein
MSQIVAQKILAVSLLSAERVKLRCVYDGAMLVVVGMERVEGNFFTWRKALAKEVSQAVEDGWQVLVEEMSDTISQHATPVLFSDPHPQEHRPMLSVALDWYFAMHNAGTIQLQPGTEMCRITESAVDVSTDEKGRNRYSLDWQRIKGPQRAVMLACLAAEGYQPISSEWINQLYAGLEVEKQADTPVERFAHSLSAHDLERERASRIVQEGQ